MIDEEMAPRKAARVDPARATLQLGARAGCAPLDAAAAVTLAG